MLVLVSSEGATNMGHCIASDQCSGQESEVGPMACLMDQLLEACAGYPFLSAALMVW